MSARLHVGIDIGSTTVKLVALRPSSLVIVYSQYTKHLSDIKAAVVTLVQDAFAAIQDQECTFSMTGSGGMGVSTALDVPFVQEVIACTEAIQHVAPGTDVAIELGGEDAKISFFGKALEQRMNGTCAGGTGSFIDHMAALLKTDSDGLNEMAKRCKVIYPIASRCGVFAKTDIQPLLNEGALKEDIAVSVLQAVVNQTISGLACGKPIRGRVAFLGGPLHFMSELRKRFIETLHIAPDDVVFPDNAQFFVAIGAALCSCSTKSMRFSELISRLSRIQNMPRESVLLPPMFATDEEYNEFVHRHATHKVPRADPASFNGRCFLGIDSGSTTSKLVLIDERGRLVYSFYESNQGSPLATTVSALLETYRQYPGLTVLSAASTGYGEGLMKAALHVDIGEIETIAHYKAAEFFLPNVDFVLDIGGQDMKSMRTRNGAIDSIMLNEACSSGCGSFISTFANSLNMDVQTFAAAGVRSKSPVDLGTRCTVFMNSRVKQAQKEGAAVEDISGGIAISIVKNALFKVIRMRSPAEMGERIVVQGGTFLNDSVLRAFERLCGRDVVRPDIAGIMGAFGAALIARERYTRGHRSTVLGPEGLAALQTATTVQRCGRCANNCLLTVNRFSDGGHFISGNRCERGSVLPGVNAEINSDEAPNMYTWKYKRLFQHYVPLPPAKATRGDVGIPRVLNMYEDYPFWFTMLTSLGCRVLLSAPSTSKTYQLGMETIPSDTVCYPAKLAHGHILSLVARDIHTIFYPCVIFNIKEDPHGANVYNCPVVGSYPEVVRHNMRVPEGTRLLCPFLPLDNPQRLEFRVYEELKMLYHDLTQAEVSAAVCLAYKELEQYKADVRRAGEDALREMRRRGLHGLMLLGRPYHVDPEINHGIPDTITANHFAVFSEDSLAHLGRAVPFEQRPLRVIDQWVYHSRLYTAARFVAEQPDLDVLQLVSFGCGLDAVTTDQVKEIVERYGKIYTSIKIDEISNLGAARIRIRSLVSIIHERQSPRRSMSPLSITPPPQQPQQQTPTPTPTPTPQPVAVAAPEAVRPQEVALLANEASTPLVTELPPFPSVPLVTKDMLHTHLGLAPQFSPYHMELFLQAFKAIGFPRLAYLPHLTRDCIEEGLKYVHNDACFPAICVIGQLMHALKSGRYNPNKIVVLLVQTGGCCRATNYVSFMRKALLDAGMPQVPVFALNAYGMEDHPAWQPTLRMPFRSLAALIYGDLFMQMVQRVRPYELVKGSTAALHQHCMGLAMRQLVRCRRSEFAATVHEIIRLFDELPIDEVRRPRVGIVGEIMVKLAADANNHLVDFLEAEGAEAVTYDLSDFFLYCTYDHVTRNELLAGTWRLKFMSEALITVVEYMRDMVRDALSHSRRFSSLERIEELAQLAEQHGVSLCNQVRLTFQHRYVNDVAISRRAREHTRFRRPARAGS
eukprot:TRINITY_DN661_c0_g1_i2.p1 TRINITY_DN661_c0_g1~~TRINITY_DN661_c0_g1_i2.p1  ORF type:complete len:1422 (+),score=351.32 TRINITY_DN661_c0_g1_i2:101-4366(+)